MIDFQRCTESQSRTCGGRAGQACGSAEHLAHPLGEIGRERKLAAFIGGDRRLARLRADGERAEFVEPFEAQDLAARTAKVSPMLSWLRNHSSISPSTRPPVTSRLPSASAHVGEPDLQHLGFDDGADIEPVLLGEARMGEAQVGRRPAGLSLA